MFGAEDRVGTLGSGGRKGYEAPYREDEKRMNKFSKLLFHLIYILRPLSLQTPDCAGLPPVVRRLIIILAAYLINKNKAIIDVAQLFVLRHNTLL